MATAPAPERIVCSNCAAPLYGRFCATCGQEALPLSPTLRDLVHEAIAEQLDVDGRTVRSVRALFFSPGLLTREQFEGRRVRWLSPLRLYLIFSVAYFAVAAMVGASQVRVSIKAGGDADATAALQRMGYQSEQDLELALQHAQTTWMPRVMFVLVPLFGWLVALVRRRAGKTYPQHLQFALHTHAAWFGARAAAATTPLLGVAWLRPAADAVTFFYTLAYIAIALRVAYGGTRGRALRDTALLTLVYGFAVIVATLGVLLPVMRPFFGF